METNIKEASQVVENLAGKNTKHDEQSSKNNSTKKSDTMLIDYAKSKFELFCNYENEAYAKIKVDGHLEILAIDSQGFHDFLRSWYYKKTKKGVPQISLDSALSTISAIARFDSYKEKVYLRVAQIGNEIYIDLCNKKWQCIKVTDTEWLVENKSPVAFIRTHNMLPLPYPDIDGDINLLLKHINIQKSELPLIVGWILMALQAGKGAYPILLINGCAGSGKTTACRMLRKLIDPNKVDLLSQPKIEELRVISTGNHVFAFDNISNINPAFSDAMCRVSTGDHQSFRKYYTTNSEETISIKKPIIFNGISELAKRGDLVTRSLKIALQKIEDRKTEDEAWLAFDRDSSKIFSALLDGLSTALCTLNNTYVDDMTRMADFCRWATASHYAFDWQEGAFMHAYIANIKASHVDSLESSTFASALMKMFESETLFSGTPMQLLEKIEERHVTEKVVRSLKWVTTAKGVVEQLDRNQESLEAVGIFYEKSRDRQNKTLIQLTCKEDLQFKNSDCDIYPFEYEPPF